MNRKVILVHYISIGLVCATPSVAHTATSMGTHAADFQYITGVQRIVNEYTTKKDRLL